MRVLLRAGVRAGVHARARSCVCPRRIRLRLCEPLRAARAHTHTGEKGVTAQPIRAERLGAHAAPKTSTSARTVAAAAPSGLKPGQPSASEEAPSVATGRPPTQRVARARPSASEATIPAAAACAQASQAACALEARAERCFASFGAGTLISMGDGTVKPIEAVSSDRLACAHRLRKARSPVAVRTTIPGASPAMNGVGCPSITASTRGPACHPGAGQPPPSSDSGAGDAAGAFAVG